MTNDCLVKKVNGNANIERPQYLGELRFALKDMQTAQSIQLVSNEPGVKFKVIGGHFEDNHGTNIGDSITTSSPSGGGYGSFYKVMKDNADAVIVYPKYKTRVLRASDDVFSENAINLDNIEGSGIIDIYGYANSTIGTLRLLPSNLETLDIYDSAKVTGALSDLLKYTHLKTVLINYQTIDIDIPLKGLYPLSELIKINCYAYGVIEDFVALQIAKMGRTSCASFNIVWPSHNLTFDGVDAASGQANNILSWTAGSTSGQYNLTYNGTTITIVVNSDGTWSKVS